MSFENVLMRNLLPMFKNTRDEMHPWWWPRGAGTTDADWFGCLTADEVEVAAGQSMQVLLKSLRGGRTPAVRNDYDGFMGAFGTQRLLRTGEILVLLSDRPSEGAFPAGIVTTLVGALAEVGLPGVHVTDLIRRRGPGSSHLLPIDEALRAHVECLKAELDWLTTETDAGVLVVPIRQHTARLIEHIGWDAVSGGNERVRLARTVLPFWSRGGRRMFVDGLWGIINDPL